VRSSAESKSPGCRQRNAAADNQRSLTSLVEKLLTDYLQTNGYMKSTHGTKQ
jgi:hypothetical protein